MTCAMMRALLALGATLAGGCAAMVDGAYLIAGPNTRGEVASAALGTGTIEHHREVAVHPTRGFVCRDVETPYVTTSRIAKRSHHPNGYKLPMQVFTVLEGSITAIALGAREASCAKDGCDDHGQLYLYLIPLFADIAWGTYRSLTIHNEIVRESEVGWMGDRTAVPGTVAETSCPPGTELPLYAGVDTLVVHVGEEGFVADAEVDVMLRFVLAHPTLSIGGALRFEAAGMAELVAHARSKLAPPPVATAATGTTTVTTTTTITPIPPPPIAPPPPPPPPPPVSVPASVCIDNPLAEICVRAPRRETRHPAR